MLISLFFRILMFMIWFTLPAPHAISVKDIHDLLTHFHLGTIAEKVCRSATVNDVIREDAGKHGYALQRINIGEERCSANKDLCIFLATINSRDIGFNGVSSNVLIVVSHELTIKARFGDLKCFQRTVL
jgi:hypothetical protein